MKQQQPEHKWTQAQLEEGKEAWDAIVKGFKSTGSDGALARLDIMILESGAEHVIARTVEPTEWPENEKEIYRKALRFREYDFNNPVDNSRPGVTECFVAPKPTTKPW